MEHENKRQVAALAAPIKYMVPAAWPVWTVAPGVRKICLEAGFEAAIKQED